MSWRHVRGHEAVAASFDRALRRGRLAHAYLFTGPAGVGKYRFAAELAKALLCEAPPPGPLEACDRCPACLLADAGTHPDIFRVARADENTGIAIDDIRELQRRMILSPARGRRKVAIVDDADALNDPINNHPSANCFLKTLEEPARGSVILLVGSEAERQLPTIVSRCQQVRFRPLSEAAVAELLQDQGVADAAEAPRLARLSGGSPGFAAQLADPGLWTFRRTLIEELARPHPSAVTLAKAWLAFAEEAGKEGPLQRRRATLALRLFVDFLHDALRTATGAEPLHAEPEDQPLREALLRRTGAERLAALVARCLEADEQMERRVQLVLILEALADALCR